VPSRAVYAGRAEKSRAQFILRFPRPINTLIQMRLVAVSIPEHKADTIEVLPSRARYPAFSRSAAPCLSARPPTV